MEFYSDTVPWSFEIYPTWDDCMRFYMSRIVNKVPQKTIINQLAEAVESIWKTGDGCPKAKSSIMKQFENHAVIWNCFFKRQIFHLQVRPLCQTLKGFWLESLTNQVQSLWQPKIGEHVIVNFEDGWYVGEVLTEEENEEVQISFMKVK